MKDRYIRQTVLPEIGDNGQKKISNASVLYIGAGGLGSPCLLYLAAAGVGKIGIVDFDTVDESNLQRQILFTTSQLGENKAKASKKRLQELNPEINIISYPTELNDKNAAELFQQYDVIIDGTDNFSTKFLINDAAVKTKKPLVYGSILGFDGQVSVFNYNNSACYRCLFPKPPEGHIPNCAEAGVIGAVAGIVGTVQAMQAIKIIVGHPDFKPLTNKLWTIDARSMDTKLLTIPKNSNCSTCSKGKSNITLQYTSPICLSVLEITPEQTRQKKDIVLIDVREKHEWDNGHIQNAQLLPLSSLLENKIPNISKEQELIIYCQKGIRGRNAAQILLNHGYSKVKNMTGGYEAWLKSI